MLCNRNFQLWLDVFGEIKEAFNAPSDNPLWVRSFKYVCCKQFNKLCSSPLLHLVMYWRDTEEVPDRILEGLDGTLELNRGKLVLKVSYMYIFLALYSGLIITFQAQQTLKSCSPIFQYKACGSLHPFLQILSQDPQIYQYTFCLKNECFWPVLFHQLWPDLGPILFCWH